MELADSHRDGQHREAAARHIPFFGFFGLLTRVLCELSCAGTTPELEPLPRWSHRSDLAAEPRDAVPICFVASDFQNLLISVSCVFVCRNDLCECEDDGAVRS